MDQEIKRIEEMINKFEMKTNTIQSNQTEKMRRDLRNNLNNQPSFLLKNQYIEKEIELHGRFFNEGYNQFQQMIVDVRKQIKLNEEILILRKKKENK